MHWKKCLKDIEKRLKLKCLIPTCNKHCSRQSFKTAVGNLPDDSSLCTRGHAAWKCSYNTQHYFKLITTWTLSSHKHLECIFKMLFQNTAFQKNAHIPVSQKKPLYPDQKHNAFLVHERKVHDADERVLLHLCVCWEDWIYLIAVLIWHMFWSKDRGLCWACLMSMSSMNNHCPLVR